MNNQGQTPYDLIICISHNLLTEGQTLLIKKLNSDNSRNIYQQYWNISKNKVWIFPSVGAFSGRVYTLVICVLSPE